MRARHSSATAGSPPSDTGKSTAGADGKPSRSGSHDDDNLRLAAEHVADLYYSNQRALVSDHKVLALAAKSQLKAVSPELNRPRLYRVLHFLAIHRDAYRFFVHLTRNAELAQFLLDHGMDWDEFYLLDPPTAADWVEFLDGVVRGIAVGVLANDLQVVMAPRDIAYAIYVAVGRNWKPELAEKFAEFENALRQLFDNPLVVAGKAWSSTVNECEQLLAMRQYGNAGYRLGFMAPGILFTIIDIAKLGKSGVNLVLSLPRLTLAAIDRLQMLGELARFYISTLTRGVAHDGTILQRLEHTIVVVPPGRRAERLDLAALSASERKMWDAAVRAEQEAALALKSGKPMGAHVQASNADRATSGAARGTAPVRKAKAPTRKALGSDRACGGENTLGGKKLRGNKAVVGGKGKAPAASRPQPVRLASGKSGLAGKRGVSRGKRGVAPVAERDPRAPTAREEVSPLIDNGNNEYEEAVYYWAQVENQANEFKTFAISEGSTPVWSGPSEKKAVLEDFFKEVHDPSLSDSAYHVQRYEDLSGRRPRSGNDSFVRGDNVATHAEVKERVRQFNEGTNKRTGVSKDMCPDCRLWHREVAMRQGVPLEVMDESFIRRFNPDGTVDIFSHDHEFLRKVPAGTPPAANRRYYEGIDW